MRKIDLDKELIKIIDTQIKFADLVFKDFRGKRFGMTTCTPETLNTAIIEQYICSWEGNKASFSGSPTSTIATTTWRRRMDPPAFWITYAPFSDYVQGSNVDSSNLNNPCRGTCATDENCSPYPPHTDSTVAVIIDSSLISSGQIPNESGQAVLYAQVAGNIPGNTINWRCTGEVSLSSAALNGNIQLPVYGDNQFTVAVDGALASESIRFVLRDGCKIYQIVFDDSEWEVDIQGYNSFPAESDDAFWNCGFESSIVAGVIEGACKTINITKPPLLRVLCNACFGGADADCPYCGMEIMGPDENGKFYLDCVNDAECIHIYVKNQCGDPVKDYDIYIDNKYLGKTNDLGYITTTILQASTNWNHLLNFCHCFTTTGNCNQRSRCRM